MVGCGEPGIIIFLTFVILFVITVINDHLKK
jgi:hypothetical protein